MPRALREKKMKQRMVLQMLNKSRIFVLLILLIICNLYSNSLSSNNHNAYSKFEYDLADYLPNVNGRGEVFINESNKNDCCVKMYFYTSMYQIYYYISFTEHSFKGFSEKITYNEQYTINNSKKELLEDFEGKKSEISKQSERVQKHLNLALELIDESLK